jgi:transposase-like protein
MVLEHANEHASQWAAITSIAEKIGCAAETLRIWVRQAQRDQGERPGLTTEERQRLKPLERENVELRRANEILKKAAAYFAQAETRPPSDVMVGFINDHRDAYGVEPICAVLPIAPSLYYELRAGSGVPTGGRCARAGTKRSAATSVGCGGRHDVYGLRKAGKQLRREGRPTARCTVARLMRQLGLQGVVQGRTFKPTTIPEVAVMRPPDLVTRRFTATRPNQLWVADLTYVATWRGFVYVAFVIDVFARRIVGWRASSSLRAAIWRSTRWSRRSTIDRSRSRSGWCITATAACSPHPVPVDPLHRAAGRSGHRAVGRDHGGFVRQRAGRVRYRAVQDGRDPPSGALERGRGRRVRDARVGRVV